MDEFRNRYSIFIGSCKSLNFPLILSFTKIVGGLRSASDIGLKEIQKLAKDMKSNEIKPLAERKKLYKKWCLGWHPDKNPEERQ